MAYYFNIFFFFSFLGFLLETVYAAVKKRRLVNRKTMYFLPLCCVYGFGAVALSVVLTPFRESPLVVILLGALTGTAVEYLFGIFFKNLFKVSFWDYSREPFNYKGVVSLTFSFYWGIISVIFIYVIFPIVQPIAIYFPLDISAFLASIFVADCIATFAKISQLGKGVEPFEECPVMKRVKP